MNRDPPFKKILYWCPKCNVPLVGKTCSCGGESKGIPLLKPYEVRPALSHDMELITGLVREKFGQVPLSKVILLNKSGGADRTDLVIMNGDRFGWLIFDPVERVHRFDIAVEALPFIIDHVTKGIVDIEADTGYSKASGGRIGGKRIALTREIPDGSVIVKYRNKYGTGIVKDGKIKVKELVVVEPVSVPDPDWEDVIEVNKYHLKNLERNAVRSIKQHMRDRPTANVSFSGGKDSTVVLNLARKAGIKDAFFVDTGLEFPETIEFVRSTGVRIIDEGNDFWRHVEKSGPPTKDDRWCCKLLKIDPLGNYLSEIGPCVSIQGNRWYESWSRAGIEEVFENPVNPLQLNVSPIRSWRAFEVYLYIWWQDIPVNPLYDKGLERIGCYLCPAMLESEYEVVRRMHPELAKRWDKFLDRQIEKKKLPAEYRIWGLWRWKELPPKMKEICRERGVSIESARPSRKTSLNKPPQNKKNEKKETRYVTLVKPKKNRKRD